MQGKDTLRAGLIGCGNIGRAHADALKTLDGMDMVAFCDIDRERAREMCALYGGTTATDDPDELFDDDALDAIYICTWHDTHADLCIRAANVGKHVMVEKPLALTLRECRAVGEAVKRAGIKLMTAFKMRYYELVRKARELIPNPLVVTMQMMDNPWGTSHWASDPRRGGGNVLSQGCHSCDLLRFIVGSDPLEVYAVGDNYYTATGVIDNLTAVFRFENGTAASWVQGDASCPAVSKFFLQAFDYGRSVTLSDRFCTLTYIESGKEPQVWHGTETGFVEENRAFIECLRTDTLPPIDHVDGLMATLMVLQAFASIRTGRPQPIAAIAREYTVN